MTAYIPGGGSFTISVDNGAMTAYVNAPLSVVWRMMPVVYDSIGLQLSLIDPRRHTIGNEGIKLHARLGNQRLSTYLDCGNTQVGPNADSYEVMMSMLTQLDSVEVSKTRVTTTLGANAKPLQFAQNYSRCTSKATLEKRIMDVLTRMLLK